MNYYRQMPGPYPSRQFFPFLGAPLLGGFVGGLLGSALIRPRPYGPYGYGGYPGYPGYGPYGGGYFY